MGIQPHSGGWVGGREANRHPPEPSRLGVIVMELLFVLCFFGEALLVRGLGRLVCRIIIAGSRVFFLPTMSFLYIRTIIGISDAGYMRGFILERCWFMRENYLILTAYSEYMRGFPLPRGE